MQFSEYTNDGPISVGATTSIRGAPILELSDGSIVLLDIEGTKGRVRKYTDNSGTPTASQYLRNSDDDADLVVDLTNHVEQSLDMSLQPGRDQFVTIAPVSGSGIQVNIWDNNLTLVSTFMNNNAGSPLTTLEHYGCLSVDSSGNFAIMASPNTTGDPIVSYYTFGAENSSWIKTVNVGANEWFHTMIILSDGNLATTVVNRNNGQAYLAILDRADGNILSSLTSITGTLNHTNSMTLVAYDGYFGAFWVESSNDRYAKRFTNAGVLQSQASYLVENGTSGLYRDPSSTLVTTSQGETLVTAIRNDDGDDYIHLALHDPANFQGSGQMNEDTTTLTQVGATFCYPEVNALSGDGGFAVSYIDYTAGELYYQLFRFNATIDPNRTWGWWWKSPLRPKMKAYGIQTIYPWGKRPE